MEAINDMNVLLQAKNYWDIQNDRCVIIERRIEKPTLKQVVLQNMVPELSVEPYMYGTIIGNPLGLNWKAGGLNAYIDLSLCFTIHPLV